MGVIFMDSDSGLREHEDIYANAPSARSSPRRITSLPR